MNNNNRNDDELERDPNTLDWVEEETGSAYKHLSTAKHPQRDFFIADLFDAVSLQLDMASMEFPLFALKAGDKKRREYIQNNFSVIVAPSAVYGLATIHDKDIWVYCVSKIMQAIYQGEEVSRTVHFTIYDYLKTTNRAINGTTYERTKDSLDRLRSTTITTNIETDKKRESRGFGLVDSWRVVEEKDGRMVRVSVTLPHWLYRSVTSKNVLTISPDYFRIRKPLDRRIYEIARKHCGANKTWDFTLKVLHERTGSTASLREFRRSIKSLAYSDELPDYSVYYDDLLDKVTFNNRNWTSKKKANENQVSLQDFNSKFGSGTKEEIAIQIFRANKLLSQEVIEHYAFTAKDLKILRATANKMQQSNETESKQKQAETFVLTRDYIKRFKKQNMLVTDPGILKTIISDEYASISNRYEIVDPNKQSMSENYFKSLMYEAFNLQF